MYKKPYKELIFFKPNFLYEQDHLCDILFVQKSYLALLCKFYFQVEKAINRIQQSTTNSLYIAESSIIKKIPTELNVKWRPLLLSVGFRFENAHNDLPDSVFFPDAEYKEQLFSASTTLFSMLGKFK